MNQADGVLERAEALCELRRYEEALALLSRAVASDPDSLHAWCLIAQAHLGLDRYREAVKAAETAIALAPEEEWPHRLASVALQGLGNYVQATRAAEEAVRLAPDTWQTHVQLAHAASRAWRLDLARVASDRALLLAPEEADVHLAVGAVASAAGHPKEAESHFRRALVIEPDNAVAHNELARLHLKYAHGANPAGLARAAAGFATAVRSDPRAAVSRRNLELVVREFLRRVAYGVWIGTYLIARLARVISPSVGRIVALVLLGILLLFVWGFVGRLTTHLRHYLLRELLGRRLRLPAGLEVLAVFCLFAGFSTSASLRLSLTVAAPVAALIARLLLWRDARTARA
jgi:tetratricopeptide (TPR) repeat protein